MRMKRVGYIIAALGIIMLILDSQTGISGAMEGIELCLQCIIPSIFPFLVLTTVLIPVLLSGHIPVLQKQLCAPGIFLAGLLGGYPSGAQMVSIAWQQRGLNTENARRMLAYTNNAGPSFLFGILSTQFPDEWILWALWGCHILSAVMVAMVIPAGTENSCRPPVQSMSWTDSVKKAVRTIGYICGWVILFRIVLAFLDKWVLWLLPIEARVAFYGILELANGCHNLGQISCIGLRFIICSGILSFGGLCVLMQTSSVTGKLGLSCCIPGKLLQTLFSVMISYLIQYYCLSEALRVNIIPPLWIIFFAILMIIPIMAAKKKIRGRNPMKIGV